MLLRFSTAALVLQALLVPSAIAAQQFGTRPAQPVPRPAAPVIRPVDDIRFLTDDRLAGRMTGSPGADSAATYIARRFEQVGLQPAAGGWFQTFSIARHGPPPPRSQPGLASKNVIGILPGSDPELRNETVIVGAHYDHLGLGGFGSLDPDSTGRVHNGADDNASGVAAMIEVAARLAADPPARTVVFIGFSGEELGLLGSGHYVKHPIYPLATTLAMINLDMVGRLRNGRLIAYGTETAREFPALLDSLNWYAGFELKKSGDGFGPSDHSSFYAANRPVLHLFTDLHEDYHRTGDDWNKVNLDGLKRVADFTIGLVTALANRPRPLSFVARADPPPDSAAHLQGHAAETRGYGAYLGTVPDMLDNPGGVRLIGVRAGSPAERAGLRGDDIITRLGGKDIPDLRAMAEALRSHQPGDVVEIVVRRGNSTATLRAKLGTRGS